MNEKSMNDISNDDIDRLIHSLTELKADKSVTNLYNIKSIVDSYLNKSGTRKESESVEIDMGDCKIQFYSYKGDKALTGDIVRPWMWELISDKIKPESVRSVTIPQLRYDSDGTESLKLLVEIEPTY